MTPDPDQTRRDLAILIRRCDIELSDLDERDLEIRKMVRMSPVDGPDRIKINRSVRRIRDKARQYRRNIVAMRQAIIIEMGAPV